MGKGELRFRAEPLARQVKYSATRRYPVPFTFQEAEALCRQEGKILAIVSSLEEQLELVRYLEEYTIESRLG